MRKQIQSSWNPDRIAGSLLSRKRRQRTAKPVSMMKTYKTGELFTELYGREAYEAWQARETEIDELMRDRARFSVADIISLREQNYQQMKAAAANREKRVTPVAPLGWKLQQAA